MSSVVRTFAAKFEKGCVNACLTHPFRARLLHEGQASWVLYRKAAYNAYTKLTEADDKGMSLRIGKILMQV